MIEFWFENYFAWLSAKKVITYRVHNNGKRFPNRCLLISKSCFPNFVLVDK